MDADMMAAMPANAMDAMNADQMGMVPPDAIPGSIEPDDGGMGALDAALDPMAANPPPGTEGDQMADLDAALGGAMDQAMDQGAGGNVQGTSPDAAVDSPSDSPDTDSEPEKGPDEPIVG